jgi:hypothetical protein
VYEFKYSGGSWQTIDVNNAGTPLYALAVGDADNDHHFEVYSLGQNNHVYQFKLDTVVPTATPTFDVTAMPSPTPSTTPTALPPQKYFKIFNSQINPDNNEQAIIRWTQPQAGAVSIIIYTLNGDKVISLVDHQNYGAGQYNEVKWDGKNQDGQAVGSGIYIVLLKAPGYQEVQKIAVIK